MKEGALKNKNLVVIDLTFVSSLSLWEIFFFHFWSLLKVPNLWFFFTLSVSLNKTNLLFILGFVYLGVMGNWRNRPSRRIFRQRQPPRSPPRAYDPEPPPGNSNFMLLFKFPFLFFYFSWFWSFLVNGVLFCSRIVGIFFFLDGFYLKSQLQYFFFLTNFLSFFSYCCSVWLLRKCLVKKLNL